MTDIPASVPANVKAALEAEGVMKVPGGGSGFSSRHENDAEAELFNFEGRAAKEAEEAKAKETKDTKPPEEVDARRVEREQPDETEVEGDEEKPKAPPKEEEAEEPEGVALADDLDGLAEQIGIKPEDIHGLKVKVGDQQYTLAEVLKGYSPEAKAKEAEIVEGRRQLDEAAAQVRQTWTQKMQQVDGLLEHLKGQFAQEPNWDQLLESDPTEYLRQKAAWEKRADSFRQAMNARLQMQQQEQTEHQTQRNKTMSEQYGLLLKERPELKDEAKWKDFSAGITAYAKAEGFADLLADVAHHKAFIVIDKARKWDALQKGKPEIQKKLVKLPPVTLKPGVKSRPMDADTRNLLDARKRLARNPNDPEAGAALFESMFQRKTNR